MTATTTGTPSRTYGGWRRARSLGLGRLDGRQTVIVLASLMAPMLTVAFGATQLAAAIAVIGLVASVGAVAHWDGAVLADALIAHTRFRLAAWRGETTFRAGVFTEYPRVLDLPGVLAPTQLLEVDDPIGGRTGIVWNRRTGTMSATLLLSPAGAIMADRATVARRVADWGDLLAGLADDPTVRHATVTVELVPEPGTQLADHLTGRLDPSSPKLARTMLAELVAATPHGSARVTARLTLAVDPYAAVTKPKSIPECAAEVLRSLAGLNIAVAGAEVMRRATATDLIRAVRTAYDPDSQSVPAPAWQELTWADAGPINAEEYRGHYVHDGGLSVSWALLAAPRQQVAHDVLLPLLTPSRYPRRVTICYRTLSREEAGALLEREVNAAAAREEYRRRTKRDSTARDTADSERATRAAAEEAHGAGLVQFYLFVTTTVTDSAQLPEARREVEQAAGRARLRLRPAYDGQAAAFAVSLPCGIHPATA
jgi:hypothetical protein